MKYGIIFLMLVGSLMSCKDRHLVQPKDYKVYLTPDHFNKAVERNKAEIAFWQARLQRDSQSFVNLLELGYNYISLFKLNGAIRNLKWGDSLLRRAAAQLNHADPGILQALAQVAITQHQFKEARWLTQQAFEKNGSPFIHALLSFDVDMELGQYHTAYGNLNVLKDRQSFDYLIRKARHLDHIGDLAGAICYSVYGDGFHKSGFFQQKFLVLLDPFESG
jgi:hypothetical protein